MAEKNTNKSIPTSVLIADTRNKLNEIANHPLLPPAIVEVLFKEAWQAVAIKAQSQLVSDYEKYQADNKENTEQNNEEDNNGL